MESVIRRASAEEFKWDKLGWWLVGLNLAAAANSTMYFTTQLEAGIAGWLAMNSCAPSIFIFSLGYIIGCRIVMAVGAGLLLRYGTLGLFVFGWKGMNIVPQVGHVLMTLALIYFVVKMIRLRGWGELFVCAAVPALLFYAGWQGNWLADHPRVFEGLFRGELTPEMFR